MRAICLCVLGVIATSAAAGCGSSNAYRPDPLAQQRENERIRADADDSQKSLQSEEDKRSDQPSDQPNN